MSYQDRRWGQPERSSTRQRGGFMRGHLVRKSSKNDRQRYDFETVSGFKWSDVEDSQPVGFTSNPGTGDNTEVIVAELGGEASRLVIIAKVGDSEKHLQVEEGSMAIYSPDDPGQKIVINKDGSIEITSTEKCIVNVPNIYLGGEDGAKKVAMVGTKTSDGAEIVDSGTATKVWAV